MNYVYLTLGVVMFIIIGCMYGTFPWWLLFLVLGGIFIFIVCVLLWGYINEPYRWNEEEMDKELKKIRQKEFNERMKKSFRNVSNRTIEEKPSVFRKAFGIWAGADLLSEFMKHHKHHDTHDYTDDYTNFEGIDGDDMFD